jgi:predicted nucleotidyltransferase component of viral defense system
LSVLAIKGNRLYEQILTYYFIERFLYRLSISEFSSQFILKGGVYLYAKLKNNARSTRDIDFLAQGIENSKNEVERIFSQLCDMDCDDGVYFDKASITIERIKASADGEGLRIRLIAYIEKTQSHMQFDIGFGDIVMPTAIIMDYPVLLSMEQPRVLAYSMESVIAEKFVAIIFLAEINSRMKDFFDIYALSRNFDFNGKELYEAISQTFQIRGTQLPDIPAVFSKEFPFINNKKTQWRAFQKRIQIAEDFDFASAVDQIRRFLFPIYECIQNNVQFSGNWYYLENTWIYNES